MSPSLIKESFTDSVETFTMFPYGLYWYAQGMLKVESQLLQRRRDTARVALSLTLFSLSYTFLHYIRTL